MRLLLDEHLPIGLAAELPGHAVDTVSGRGWSGIKNGELLRRMSGQYDVLVTMDRSIEFQQRISTLPFGIVLVRARSNRMEDLRPLVPSILSALAAVERGRIRRRAVRGKLRGSSGGRFTPNFACQSPLPGLVPGTHVLSQPLSPHRRR